MAKDDFVNPTEIDDPFPDFKPAKFEMFDGDVPEKSDEPKSEIEEPEGSEDEESENKEGSEESESENSEADEESEQESEEQENLEQEEEKPAEKTQAEEPESEIKDDELQFDLESVPDLNSEEYDDELVNGRKALKEEVGKLQKQVKTLKNASNETANNAFAERFDTWIDSDSSHEKFLGKGKGSALKSDSPEFNTRIEILQTVKSLYDGHVQAKRAIPAEKELFEQAKRVVLGEKLNPKESSNEARSRRSKQRMVRPQSNKSKSRQSLNPEARAHANAKKWAKDNGLEY